MGAKIKGRLPGTPRNRPPARLLPLDEPTVDFFLFWRVLDVLSIAIGRFFNDVPAHRH